MIMKTKTVKRSISLLVLVLFGITSLFGMTYEELFDNYCKQDIQYEELAISYKQAELSYEQSLIENGLKVTVSSGNVKMEFAENQVKTSFSPSLSVTVPSLLNTEAKISVPVSVDGENVSVQNAGISLSADIISSTNADRDLSSQKSLRSLEEAERKLKSKIVSLEKSFLNELKNLYSLELSVSEAESNLLSKQNSFESVKLQGYSENSSKYRSAQLSVRSSEYDLEKAIRNYENSLESFLTACNAEGLDINSLKIPETTLLSITDFPMEKFSTIESAVWSNYVNSTSRNNKKDFTLSANTSANVSTGRTSENPLTTSIGAGLTAAYKGLSGNMNLSLPTSDNSNPSVTFSLSWNPIKDKTSAISKETAELQEQQEALSLKKAYQEYEKKVDDLETQRKTLLWQYEKNLEEASMYKELEADTEYWYKQGIVSESEYQSAKTNYAKAQLAVISSKIEQLIYNLDLQSLFVE